MARRAEPCPACLATPRRALPRLALPCLAAPALPCLASPCRASPRLPCLASPRLASPRRACLAVPRRALPRRASPRPACRASPCLPCLALPCHAEPCHAEPALPRPAEIAVYRSYATDVTRQAHGACPVAWGSRLARQRPLNPPEGLPVRHLPARHAQHPPPAYDGLRILFTILCKARPARVPASRKYRAFHFRGEHLVRPREVKTPASRLREVDFKLRRGQLRDLALPLKMPLIVWRSHRSLCPVLARNSRPEPRSGAVVSRAPRCPSGSNCIRSNDSRAHRAVKPVGAARVHHESFCGVRVGADGRALNVPNGERGGLIASTRARA